MNCPGTTIQRVMCSESVFYFIYIYDMYFVILSPMYYPTKEVRVVGVYDFLFVVANNKILNNFHEEFRPRVKILKQLANPTAHVLKLNIGVVSHAYPNLKTKII